jgi:PKD repeat protein
MKKLSSLLTLCLLLAIGTVSAQQCSALFYHYANGTTVSFQDSSFASSGNIVSFAWDFGDGNSSTVSSTSHTYSQAGSYIACLTITTSLGCRSTFCDSIIVSNGPVTPPCQASYNYTVDTNNVAYFSNTSTSGPGVTYTWDFGDGSATSSATHPQHAYANSGAYVVQLTVNSNGTTCYYLDTAYVNYCNAYFWASASSNGSVSFTNYSAAPQWGVAYNWDFGDGNYSNVKHPTHTYASSGTYLVTLSLFDSLNNCSSSYTDSLVVNINTGQRCTASYTVAKDSTVPYGVIIYNTSTNSPSNVYTWDFGDGTTGSGRTPIHQYPSFGSYVVCLTVSDPATQCTSTFCDTIGMDTLGNLKAGFGIRVVDALTVGIEEESSLSHLNAYPNPASNTIKVDLRSISQSVNIRIIDLSGRVIQERSNVNAGNVESFDISELESGFYFMILNDGNNQKVEKFIKAE